MTQELLYLSRADVEAAGLRMADIIAAVERGFVEMGHNRVEMPPKPGIHPGSTSDNFIHYVPALNTAGIKWVSGYPGNPAKGLPYIMGLLILNEPDTGLPLAVMDCGWITGMRTGAASAVSAKYLARPESETIGILACGVQGHTNLEAMSVQFPLKKVMAFDVHADQSRKLVDFAQAKLGLSAQIVDDPRQAVSGCDIVVTSGPILKKPHETIRAGWLAPGTFVSCVDFDTFFSRNALQAADKWTTDYLAQYTNYQKMGYFQNCPEVYAELGAMVTGQKPGRESAEEINFAANLGLAMEDMAVAPLIYRQALAKGIGTRVSL